MELNIDHLKKKIIYRSKYRGSKEMDLLLSSFTERYINKLNLKELNNLSDLLNLDDENLYKLNQGNKTSIIIKNNKINKLFKKYVFKKK